MDTIEKIYSPDLTEGQINLIERLLKQYCKKTEIEMKKIDSIPDGPCYPPRPGTANPWAKEAAKALIYGSLEDAYEALKIIEKIKTAES